MMVRVILRCSVPLIVLITGSVSMATMTRVEPFIGQRTESWELFDAYRSTPDSAGDDLFLPNPTAILEGLAFISHPKMAIYEVNSESQANLLTSGHAQTADGQKGLALASTGPQALPIYVESASITFLSSLTAFGGYWGAATDDLFDPEIIEFEFFDSHENLIGVDDVVYTRSYLIDESQMIYWGDGQLQWTGWQFDVPMKRVVFGGGFIVADFLQANPTPEPSSLALVALATAALLTSRTCAAIRRIS